MCFFPQNIPLIVQMLSTVQNVFFINLRLYVVVIKCTTTTTTTTTTMTWVSAPLIIPVYDLTQMII